ncbi:MAG: hypothetical protein MUO23_02165 [Anaerolineales bacterium]|nr:hypothetical protein [Anaerolineales bacterium]
MPIEVNDWVVHPQSGIGRVVNQELRQFAPGTARQYFVVAIAKGTMWVPVEGAPSGFRKLTAKVELERYRGVLRGRPKPLATDSRQRQIALVDKLKDGLFQTRCEVVRDLTAHCWHKSLNESSSVLLRSAQGVLCAEWAASEGLSVIEASQEVEALLLEGRKTYEK